MAAGVGIDLIEIARLERALERHPRLAERVFSEGERGYAAAHVRPGRHLAARFAAKEAVLKALGAPGAFALHEVEIVAGKPPSVRLTGRAAERAQGLDLKISLTHARETAAAVAIADTS